MPRADHQTRPADLKAAIESNCTYIDGGHQVYAGQAQVVLDGARMPVAKAYWRLVYGKQPNNTFLQKQCGEPNCIEPDHWALSTAPAKFVPYVPPTDKPHRTISDALEPILVRARALQTEQATLIADLEAVRREFSE